MRTGILLILLFGMLTVALYSIPKSAESLRWSTADGYDCETTDNVGGFTCCKKYTVVIGGVTLSANRCVDCEESAHGGISCGSGYFTTATSLSTGGVVDPNIKNLAKDLIGKGLALLNDRTEKGGQVDPKDLNSAKALIEKSLTVLTKGETDKGTVDPKVTKDVNALIDRILSADEMIIKAAENTKIPKTGGLNDGGLLNDTAGNNDTKKVPKDLDGSNNDENGPQLNPGE